MSNPVMQFAKKAAQDLPVLMNEASSNNVVSAGMGQDLGLAGDPEHYARVRAHRIRLNMMRFDMKGAGHAA